MKIRIECKTHNNQTQLSASDVLHWIPEEDGVWSLDYGDLWCATEGPEHNIVVKVFDSEGNWLADAS